MVKLAPESNRALTWTMLPVFGFITKQRAVPLNPAYLSADALNAFLLSTLWSNSAVSDNVPDALTFLKDLAESEPINSSAFRFKAPWCAKRGGLVTLTVGFKAVAIFKADPTTFGDEIGNIFTPFFIISDGVKSEELGAPSSLGIANCIKRSFTTADRSAANAGTRRLRLSTVWLLKIAEQGRPEIREDELGNFNRF